MNLPGLRSGLAAIASVVFLGQPAAAATVTSGCASASSCTLAELFAGGSIQVDDLQMSNVVFDAGASFSSPMLDTTQISLSAAGSGTGFHIDFGNKTVSNGEFVGVVFDFDLAVIGTTRNIISATFDNWQRMRDGDPMNTNMQLTADFNPLSASPVIGVLDDFFSPLKETDTTALGPTMATSGNFTWQQISFSQTTADSLTAKSIDLNFGFDRILPPPPNVVPLPAGGLLLLGGLGTLALLRRRTVS